MWRYILGIYLCSRSGGQELGNLEQEYDILKSMENIDIYFKDKQENDPLEIERVFDILLITFVDSDIETLRRIDQQAKKELKLSEGDQEKLHFFYILSHFFSKKYRDKVLTKQLVKDMIRNMELNQFIVSDIMEQGKEGDEEEREGLDEELNEREF